MKFHGERKSRNKILNPAHWRLSILLELGPEDVHELARKTVGTLTSYRLIVGRCLLAMHESKGYKKHGCSSAIHYACARLGTSGPGQRVSPVRSATARSAGAHLGR